jgi:hypothetical protein
LLATGAANALMMEDYSARLNRVHISDMSCAQVQDALSGSSKALLTWHSKSGMARYCMYIAKDGWCRNQLIKGRGTVGTTDIEGPASVHRHAVQQFQPPAVPMIASTI